jgi:hypothetical protein
MWNSKMLNSENENRAMVASGWRMGEIRSCSKGINFQLQDK